LLVAISAVPAGKKRKLRATLSMSLGHMLGQFLQVQVQVLKDKTEECVDELFNRMSVTFPKVEIVIAKKTKATSVEEVKTVFR